MKFLQTLERTYYNQGFFNVKVAYDGLIRKDDGPIAIQFGYGGHAIPGRVDRRANLNSTARIHGRSALKKWFHANFQVGECVVVDVQAPEHIILLRK